MKSPTPTKQNSPLAQCRTAQKLVRQGILFCLSLYKTDDIAEAHLPTPESMNTKKTTCDLSALDESAIMSPTCDPQKQEDIDTSFLSANQPFMQSTPIKKLAKLDISTPKSTPRNQALQNIIVDSLAAGKYPGIATPMSVMNVTRGLIDFLEGSIRSTPLSTKRHSDANNQGSFYYTPQTSSASTNMKNDSYLNNTSIQLNESIMMEKSFIESNSVTSRRFEDLESRQLSPNVTNMASQSLSSPKEAYEETMSSSYSSEVSSHITEASSDSESHDYTHDGKLNLPECRTYAHPLESQDYTESEAGEYSEVTGEINESDVSGNRSIETDEDTCDNSKMDSASEESESCISGKPFRILSSLFISRIWRWIRWLWGWCELNRWIH